MPRPTPLLDEFKALAEKLQSPPRFGLFVSDLFPPDDMIEVTDGRETLMCMGRRYCDRLVEQCVPDKATTAPNAFMGVRVIDLDRDREQGCRVFGIIARKIGVAL